MLSGEVIPQEWNLRNVLLLIIILYDISELRIFLKRKNENKIKIMKYNIT